MKTQILKLTRPIMMGGRVRPIDTIIEVSVAEARDLIRRDRAVPHVLGDDEDAIASDATDAPLHPAIQAHEDDRVEQAAERAAEAAGAAEEAAPPRRPGRPPNRNR